MNNDSDKPDKPVELADMGKPNELLASPGRIGFCRPPEATRFKKGVSGNPKGRPKGRLNVATAFMRALREKVVINEHGQRKTVTKLEAALKQLANKGASGDLRALAQLIALAQDAEAQQNMPGAQDSVASDIDQEVMQGILKRFMNATEEKQTETTDEKNNGDSLNNERG